MSETTGESGEQAPKGLGAQLIRLQAWVRRGFSEGRSPALWLMALVVGVIAGYGALGLRLAIQTVQLGAFGAFSENLASRAAELDALHIIAATFLAGVAVSALLFLGERMKWLPETHPLVVADVIEARAVRAGKMNTAPGLLSAAIAAVSLGGGLSAGREGPAVHLGATLAAVFTKLLGLPARAARIMLACGAAAAVSASFNAPVAGALFAFEVILGHYALRSIAPVAAASVTGAVLARIHFGATPAFPVPTIEPASIADFLAVVPLGLAAAGVAIPFILAANAAPRLVAEQAKKIHWPLWALPPVGGVIVGLIGAFVPEVLGVGYEATANALAGAYGIGLLVALIAVKLVATVITLGFRFGGGVFSPSLYLGAMVGGLFGAIVAQTLGEQASSSAFFAVVGMGAVSGAVLGAPLSTTLIVFELTASYEASIALLVAVSLATVITTSVTKGSFFHKQVERHGYDLTEGNARVILQTIRARDIMSPLDASDITGEMDEPALYEDDYLGRVMGFLSAEKLDGAPVRARSGDQPITGYISKADAHAAYADALARAHAEEHR
ncbi:chloride channel protein [Marinicauda salina]|uniref:Chloride channel protein n=1 Tax=Marinicauda salina TaxID=2135793 RepID=A0A2U2BSI1_9PROT|nr:chloride channel protein [Marinicauda salina]PWE16950.1 chloride channel protein [Marinicauda salina]